jgi:hypothetical protein
MFDFQRRSRDRTRPIADVRFGLGCRRESDCRPEIRLYGEMTAAMDAPEPRFFYHSFPRRSVGAPSARGVSILRSILENGLLLTPEAVHWTDPTAAPPNNRVEAQQRRACFTELAQSELAKHGEFFGNFALEFEIHTLRKMGAMPVIYIPDQVSSEETLDQMGTSFLAHLASAAHIVETLLAVKRFGPGALPITLSFKDGRTIIQHFSGSEANALKQFVGLLEAGDGIPLERVDGALRCIASIFYPTERVGVDEWLHYYRQREWRIFSGLYKNDVSIASWLSEAQVDQLMKIDGEFFGRIIEWSGGQFTRASKCQYLCWESLDAGRDNIRRVIVPPSSYSQCLNLAAEFGLSMDKIVCRDSDTKLS